MKYLFYLGHPAHYHLFKNSIKLLRSRKNKIWIVIKSKDVLKNLLEADGVEYFDILPEGKKNSKFGLINSMLKREVRLFKFCVKNRPNIMLGSSSEITHIGKLLNIPSLVFEEDDYDAIPDFAKITYPFATTIVAPNCCSVGKWASKTIFYNGYHELAYLNPKYFSPNVNILNKLKCNVNDYFLLRFVSLNANHDFGINGINDSIAEKIIEILKPHGKIFITSERELMPQFEQYRIKLKPSEILDSLYYARLFIGDSQTMAAEAAVLGTPSLRFNDFVGRLGYLEELEHNYGLTYGIKTSEQQKLFSKIIELLNFPNLNEEWKRRKEKMLADKIDVAAFLVWFVENYPKSFRIMKKNLIINIILNN